MVVFCCVPDCKHKTGPRFSFPNPSKGKLAFKIWLFRISNEQMLGQTYDHIVKNYKVCQLHFTKACIKNKTANLISGSLPVLNLPRFSCEPDKVQAYSFIDTLKNDPEAVEMKIFGGQSEAKPDNWMQCRVTEDVLNLESAYSSLSEDDSTEIDDDDDAESGEATLPPDMTDVRILNPGSSVKSGATPQKPYFKAVKIYFQENKSIGDVCRICLQSVTKEKMIKLHEANSPEIVHIKHMLKLIYPELDLGIYSHPVACRDCINIITLSFKLKQCSIAANVKLLRLIEEQKNHLLPDSNLLIVCDDKPPDVPLIEDDSVKENSNATTIDHDYSLKIEEVDDRPIFNVMDDQFYQRFIVGISGEEMKEIVGDLKRYDWGPGPYMCDQCGFMCDQLKRFKAHVTNHGFTGQYICDKCGVHLSSKRQLDDHELKHKNVKNECHICHKNFFKSFTLDRHIKHVHLQLFKCCCELCGKEFTTKGALNQHMKILHADDGGRKFACNVCGKAFLSLRRLKNHWETHNDAAFCCEYCGKSVKEKKNLRKHYIRTHGTDFLYHCEICQRRYWTKEDWAKHAFNFHGQVVAEEEAEQGVEESKGISEQPQASG